MAIADERRRAGSVAPPSPEEDIGPEPSADWRRGLPEFEPASAPVASQDVPDLTPRLKPRPSLPKPNLTRLLASHEQRRRPARPDDTSIDFAEQDRPGRTMLLDGAELTADRPSEKLASRGDADTDELATFIPPGLINLPKEMPPPPPPVDPPKPDAGTPPGAGGDGPTREQIAEYVRRKREHRERPIWRQRVRRARRAEAGTRHSGGDPGDRGQGERRNRGG